MSASLSRIPPCPSKDRITLTCLVPQQNPNATLPTLVADGKAYVSTKEVVEYLVAHAPKQAAKGTAFIDKIHEDKYDPNAPLLVPVRAPF